MSLHLSVFPFKELQNRICYPVWINLPPLRAARNRRALRWLPRTSPLPGQFFLVNLSIPLLSSGLEMECPYPFLAFSLNTYKIGHRWVVRYWDGLCFGSCQEGYQRQVHLHDYAERVTGIKGHPERRPMAFLDQSGPLSLALALIHSKRTNL